MTTRINEILVPVDGSENAIRAARFGMQLAVALGARVRLFYVFPAASVELVGMAGMSRADIEHLGHGSSQRVFEAVRKGLEGEMIDRVEQQVVLGDPAEEIITYTEQASSLLVVIGRRGLSRIQTLLLGSVSDKVIRHARCPVTVVA
jgi:nucleotide-binding universal stress UspA family protein